MQTDAAPTAGSNADEDSDRPGDATVEPLTVDTAGLARLLGMPYSTVTKLTRVKAWQRDELPAPIYVGHGSGRGDGSGKRLWVIAHVRRWLDERQVAA